MVDLFSALELSRGPAWRNRLALGAMTNSQSHATGSLTDNEYRWLTMRAEGGFGLVMTCAAHVQKTGQGFPGQLGIFDDAQLPGLTRLAAGLREAGTVSSVQLHHAGLRADTTVSGGRVGPTDDAETGTRALTEAEISDVITDFRLAALRAQNAGFDGVEIHGAHGYLLAQFLSPTINRREDDWGGSLENRSRLTLEILHAVRGACRPDFQIGLRLSPERFGMRLGEMLRFVETLAEGQEIDYLDLSLWDFRKEPHEEAFQGRTLLSYFTSIPRGAMALGIAGGMMGRRDVEACMSAGADYAILGKAGILAHDFPHQAIASADYRVPEPPVSVELLAAQGVSPIFIEYLRGFRDLVAEP